jgi:predicted GNAT family acetyltransferase
MSADVTVTNNPEAKRYEARVGGELAGFAEYLLTDEFIVFTHTQVDPAHEGRGIGGATARSALDDVAAAGTRRVIPLCPFIKTWIGRHPDYLHLVYQAPPSTAKD